MGIRRGLLFGFFVGVVAVVTSRRAQEEVERPGTEANKQFKELLDEAREAYHQESEATEQRLRRRFTAAREQGKLPRDE